MYIPAHFAASPDDVRALLSSGAAADLITSTATGLLASTLPLVFDQDTGEHGTLRGHVARNNPQWREEPIGEALVIVRGPDAYVSPSWYASKAEHGRVVPTWNYTVVHLTGRVRVHEDAARLRDAVDELVEHHEGGRARPWRSTDAPGRFVEGQLRAVVGIEVSVERVEAKAKLSQNRSAADREGVVRGLRGEDSAGAAAVAEQMVRGLPGAR